MTDSQRDLANTPLEKKITIRFTPDESTKEAMKQFEAHRFKKKIEKDMQIISRHKIFR